MDHRPGPGTIEEKYAPRHLVFLSGQLARIVGSTKILVNSLHGQAIDTLAPGLVVEATGAGRHDRGGAGRARARLRVRCAVASGMGLRRRQRQPRAVPRVRRGVRGVSVGAAQGGVSEIRSAAVAAEAIVDEMPRVHDGVGSECGEGSWICNWPARRR